MESTSLFSVVTKGGILMIPIFICSVIVIAVAIERYLAYRKLKINIHGFMSNIRYPLNKGDYVSAVNECALVKSPIAAVVRAGLEKAKQGRDRMKEAMEAAGNNETYMLEKNLSVLATLAGITPLIGFLGTVTGMIKAFMKIQQLSGNVNADVLAGGIWEAMVTTAAGLTVGIPAMIVYNYYVNHVREFVFHMESAAEEVLDMVATSGDPENIIPEAPEEPSESRPEPPDSPDGLRDYRLADESFDPEDDSFSGGATT